MNKQTIWFIINPTSGGRKKHKNIFQLIDNQLDKQIYTYQIFYTEYAGHATEIAQQAVDNTIPIVVAVGGDGTVNEIGKVLINTKTTLGIIPIGSGNGLARDLRIPLRASQAILSLNTPVKKQIDVGYLNEIPFFCTAGIGFDAHCAEVFSRKPERGFWNYIKVGLTEFWKFKPLKCVFAGLEYEVFSITFGNASQFGNNAYITPMAVIDDGFIDCTIINPPTVRQALRIVSLLFSGNIYSSELSENYRSTKFNLQNNDDLLVHYDGEPLVLNCNELTISILEKGLTVMI